MSKKRYTITAALPYANGPLHIGHIAGAYLPPDIYVRYLKLCRHDVAFICGSDEHGAAITLRAKKENKSPKAIVDKYHILNKKAFEDFGIEFSIFDRTTNEEHYKTAQDFFLELHKKGSFQEKTTQQFYDEKVQQFLADRYITGECPKCGYASAYGDQCEKCGSVLNPTDLISPKSVLSGAKPVLKQTKHWFLPLDKHQNWMEEWLKTGQFAEMQKPQAPHNVNKWRSNVIGQCLSWINEGLKPRAMTRDLDWGVPVPLENANGKVLYVWLDAPIGYISATKKWAQKAGVQWQDYWQNAETELLHFIGKDNIVFHGIIFPILLKTHGGYIMPENVIANEFLNLEGQKISTSRNHAVWLYEYLQDFPGRQDELRYVLNAIAPETADSEFTWKGFQTRVNSELVAILGNFVNRVLVLYHKYFDGKLQGYNGYLAINNKKNKQVLDNAYNALLLNMESFKFRQAQKDVMDLARYGNRFLQENEPWQLYKTDQTATLKILNDSILIVIHLAILLQPFLPNTANKIFTLILKKNNKHVYNWQDNIKLKAGHQLGEPELLFLKIEDKQVAEQLNKLHKTDNF